MFWVNDKLYFKASTSSILYNCFSFWFRLQSKEKVEIKSIVSGITNPAVPNDSWANSKIPQHVDRTESQFYQILLCHFD